MPASHCATSKKQPGTPTPESANRQKSLRGSPDPSRTSPTLHCHSSDRHFSRLRRGHPNRSPSTSGGQRGDRPIDEVAEVHDSAFSGQQREATGEGFPELLDRDVEGRDLVRQE